MKIVLSLFFLMFYSGNLFATNYYLKINDKNYDIDIGKKIEIDLKGDDSLVISLHKKEFVEYSTDNFRFEHQGDLSPSKTNLGNGITQYMLASPLGTLVLIQEYSTLDPSGLVDLMLRELTKEEVKYGYEIKAIELTKNLKGGKILKGKSSVSTYKDTINKRQVLTYGAQDSGLLIVTQYDEGSFPDEVKIIELFWKTFNISIK